MSSSYKVINLIIIFFANTLHELNLYLPVVMTKLFLFTGSAFFLSERQKSMLFVVWCI